MAKSKKKRKKQAAVEAQVLRLTPKFLKELDNLAERLDRDGKKILEDYANSIAEPNNGYKLTTVDLLDLLHWRLDEREKNAGFAKAKNTVLLYPRVMAVRGEKCKRKKGKYGEYCTHCTKKCPVSMMLKLVEKHKITGYFPERDLRRQLDRLRKKFGELALIQISGLGGLIRQSRTARRMEIPTKGILIECANDDGWVKKPIISKTASADLETVLKEKFTSRKK
jgi:hypothetical protein